MFCSESNDASIHLQFIYLDFLAVKTTYSGRFNLIDIPQGIEVLLNDITLEAEEKRCFKSLT